MIKEIVLLFAWIAIASCTTPGPATTSLQPCKREHVLQRLKIELPCEWQVERSIVTGDTIHRFTDRGNRVMLQTGKIWNTTAHYEADSSLKASFSERRIEGMIRNNLNVEFIHGSRPVRGRGGDSLYIYLEDTSRWKYYQFDAEFLNTDKMEEFISAMEGSELVR